MEKWDNTWASVEHTLHAAGIDHAVIDDIRVATARQRHETRMTAAYHAARRYVQKVLGVPYWSRENYAFAIALCFAEAQGLYGGGAVNPGAGTKRHPAFARCGSGRRHANDGAAWTAAIAAVANEAGATFSIAPDGRLAIRVHVNSEGEIAFVPTRDLLRDDWWARRNLALHAVRRGWAIEWCELIIAAAKELAAVEAEAKEVAQETETQDDCWVEVDEGE